MLFCCNATVYGQLQTSFHRGYIDPAAKGSYHNDFDLAEASNGDFLFPFNRGGIMRTSPTGRPSWASQFTTVSGTRLQRALFNKVINVSGGDLLLFGSLTDTASGYIRTWDTPVICRVNASGALIWNKILPSSPALTYTHSKSILTANGEILMCMAQGDAVSSYPILTRMDEHGNIIWQKMLFKDTSVLSARTLGIYDIAECSNGDFVLCGQGDYFQNLCIVARISSTGSVIWAKKLADRQGAISRVPVKIREIAFGDIRVVISDPYVHMSSGGASKYGMAYFTLDEHGYVAASGKAYEIPPFTPALIKADGNMLFGGPSLLYVSNTGAIKFSYSYNAAVLTGFRTVLATADGGFAAAGGYYSGIGTIANGYLLKTDSLGDAPPFTVSLTTADTFYVNSSNTMDIILRDSTVSIGLQKSAGVTLTRVPMTVRDTLFAATVAVPYLGSADRLQVYPNPARNLVHINSPVDVDLNIYTSAGQLIRQLKGVRRADLSALLPGLYFMRVMDHDGNTIVTHRLVKE